MKFSEVLAPLVPKELAEEVLGTYEVGIYDLIGVFVYLCICVYLWYGKILLSASVVAIFNYFNQYP